MSDQKIIPDEETKRRIEHLAFVGSAINSSGFSEKSFGTDYFLAKESLSAFKQEIESLELSPRTLQGILDLIKYLDQKIDKRMRDANQ